MRKLSKPWVLSIDPSINFLGWALWKDGMLKDYGLLEPSSRQLSYLEKCREMIAGLKATCKNVPGGMSQVQIVTEIPDHFDTKGFMSRESGAVNKLAFLAGMIYGLAKDVHAYLPREWKGSLKKHVTALKLSRNKGYEFLIDKKDVQYCKECDVEHPVITLRHDIIDAIGIGRKYIHGKL